MDDNEKGNDLFWVAVKGLLPEQALAALNMEYADSAEARDAPGFPDVDDGEFSDTIFSAQLADDWLLLFGSIDEIDHQRLTRLAQLGPTFVGHKFRSGCFSEAHWYAEGQEVWSVDYDFESRGRDDQLQIEGKLPEKLAAIIGEAYRAVAMEIGRDNGVDILFEVPGKLSKAICGFSPHEPLPDGFRWSMLQPIGGVAAPEPKPRSWLSRLFG